MNTRFLGLLAIAPFLLLTATRIDVAPTVGTAPSVVATPARPQAAKILTKLEVKNAAAVPGETRNLEATLTKPDGFALPSKPVSFHIEGKNGTTVPGGVIHCGTAVTDGNGKATLPFKLPELAQGAYALKAVFDGTADLFAANDTGNMGMVKGITKFEMGDLIWGTYKNEPGPKSGTVMIKLVRQSDGQTLAKQLNITMNGTSWSIGGSSSDVGIHMMALVPLGANSWTVKVQFNGDAANQATSAERTYTKPAGG